MDFDDTQDEAQFRASVRQFLSQHGKPKRFGAGEGAPEPMPHEGEALLAARRWQRTKYEAGYSAITWSKEVGGAGGTAMQQVIYDQEEAKFDVPSGLTFRVTLGMCIPAMLAYATEEQKAYYAPRALRGEHIWCQLFSEPAAGSDIAGVRTRAERRGDKWVINGQKIWTSGAHYSDYGVLVARSDPSVPKHKGLTYFFLDMRSPGVTMRPIKQITGDAHFNEVYFTDVEIPDSQRLGTVGRGWEVVLTTLMNERSMFSSMFEPHIGPKALLSLANSVEFESRPASLDQSVRERIANWYLKTEGVRLTSFRTMTSLSRGEQPGPESSIAKAVTGPAGQEIGLFALDLQEMGGIIREPKLAAAAGRWQEWWLFSPSRRVAGGTDEIMRNIIAERVLGLPADIRVDKDIPFNKLPSGR
jgi:alkylation response protein AidB-like acyl-CoA dehydrogenase